MSPHALSPPERLAWVRLARTPNVGPVNFARLLARFSSPEAALEALPRLARRGGRAEPPAPPSPAIIEAELEALDRLGGRLLCAVDEAFPPLLRALDPPPPVISVLGDVDRLSAPAVAIVGARNASAVGRRFAAEIASGVGAAGHVVVSGLARGVDAAAHDAALKTKAGTIAVVAGGVDDVYPPEHAGLRDAIIAAGAVVSERRLGAEPRAKDFPRRNRIISGLSLGVVVIEAAERSGSLITARYALEQGRDVMAAPGSPLDPRARGANRLIRDGAALIENAQDVIDTLAQGSRLAAFEPASAAYEPPPVDETELERAADDVRARVLELLSPSPAPRDDIVRFSGAPAAHVAAALVELELAGLAAQLPGGLVASVWPDAPPEDAA